MFYICAFRTVANSHSTLILRTSNVNGDLLPINHRHHSKKVLVKPAQRGSSSSTHGMMNHQLPADWEEFWDDSGKSFYCS